MEEWPRNQKVGCPRGDCKSSILDAEIRNTLGVDIFDELQKEATLRAVEGDEGLVACSCGTVMELVQGDIDYEVKDDKGQKVS